MNKRHNYLVILSLLLVCALTFNLAGCTINVKAENLMENITPNTVTASSELTAQNTKVTDFAVRLFKASEEKGNNTLISPLSVLCALAMSANGANSETLKQMETVLGMPTTELNLYVYSYMKKLPQNDTCKLKLANSIWFTNHERFKANQNFLQTIADYYIADIYKAPFNNQTCKDINNWIKQKTDGMIPEILDKIPTNTVMYLINALAFQAEWDKAYKKQQVRDGEFTKEDGTKQKAEFMYSTEGNYLEDENAIGFIKYYKERKYAFVAMLPKENISVSEYVNSLDGESLNKLLNNPQKTIINAAIPKFEIEYSALMNNALKNMGITEAFDPNKADFTRLCDSSFGNIWISRVLHKTYISVGEKGTKAGAATIIEKPTKSASGFDGFKKIYLNRPFVYMLIDCENNIPFLIGTMMDIEN